MQTRAFPRQGRSTRAAVVEASVGKQAPIVRERAGRERERRPGNKILAVARMPAQRRWRWLVKQFPLTIWLFCRTLITYGKCIVAGKCERAGKEEQEKRARVGSNNVQLFSHIFGGESSNSCGITVLHCFRPFNAALVLARYNAREGRRRRPN